MSTHEDITLEAFTEFLNAVEAGVAAARQRIKSEKGLVKSDTTKINWVEATGGKGPYEKSDDVNNIEHKNLLRTLNENHGFLKRDGFQYWLFQNNSTIGRRKR